MWTVLVARHRSIVPDAGALPPQGISLVSSQAPRGVHPPATPRLSQRVRRTGSLLTWDYELDSSSGISGTSSGAARTADSGLHTLVDELHLVAGLHGNRHRCESENVGVRRRRAHLHLQGGRSVGVPGPVRRVACVAPSFGAMRFASSISSTVAVAADRQGGEDRHGGEAKCNGCGSSGGPSCCPRDEVVGIPGLVDSQAFLGDVKSPVRGEISVAA